MQLQVANAQMKKQAQGMKCERAKTETLLYQLLPTFVVTKLLNGNTVDVCKFFDLNFYLGIS